MFLEKEGGGTRMATPIDHVDDGALVLGDGEVLPPRKHGILIPGPQAHLMKLGFEKYFLWKMKHGHTQLP